MRSRAWAATIWRLAGLALICAGRLRLAASSYRRALAMAPGNAGIAADLAACLTALRKPDEALALCTAAVHSASEDPYLLNNLGLGTALRGDHATALTYYARALAVAPGLGAAWSNLGASLLGLDRPRLALSAYRRSLFLAPHLAAAQWGEAVCLERLGRACAATTAYNRALGKK